MKWLEQIRIVFNSQSEILFLLKACNQAALRFLKSSWNSVENRFLTCGKRQNKTSESLDDLLWHL